MKSRMLFGAAVILMLAANVQAQSLKIGYADANYILSLLPESKQAQTNITSHEKMLQTQLEAKYKDYQTKLASYQQNAAGYDEIIRRDKESELMALQQSIQQFETDAQSSIVKKQGELLQPIFKKIGDAIEQFATENGYDFILSAGAQGVDVLLYAKESHDVTNMVLKKLGVDPPAATGK